MSGIALNCSCMPSQIRSPTARPRLQGRVPSPARWATPTSAAGVRRCAIDGTEHETRLRHGHLRHRPEPGRRLPQGPPRASRSSAARSSPTKPRSPPAARACSPAATPPPARRWTAIEASPPAGAPRAASTTTCAARASSPSGTTPWTRPSPTPEFSPRPRPWRACCHCPARRRATAHQLRRGQHGLHRGAGRARGQRAASTAPSAPSAWSACAPADPAPCCTSERDKEIDLDVGAVVLATGYDLHDPGAKSEYGYRRYPNVFSALEYERLLSASARPPATSSAARDGAHPKRIAFIQCVGSRDQEHEYCSSVCCTFANKQAMLTIDHEPDCQPEIFLMDMRAQGKGFDAFYQRAVDQGCEVHPLAALIHQGRPAEPTTSSSAGRTRPAGCTRAATTWSCSLPAWSPRARRRRPPATSASPSTATASASCKEFAPLQTSREGVFVAGPFGEPKDIPDSVAQASAAAAKVMTSLADSRGTLDRRQGHPAERDVSEEEPRVGVFVCHCGTNIAGVSRRRERRRLRADLARRGVLPPTPIYTCSSDSLAQIREKIEEHDLNRVVVASCTPRTHEPIFQDTLREAGLNPYLFEMANIRDQASWVHNTEPDEGDRQGPGPRAHVASPAHACSSRSTRVDVPLTHAAVIIGGGIAGMTAADALGEMGHEVHLVERGPQLGGHVLELGRHDPGGRSRRATSGRLEQKLVDNPNVQASIWSRSSPTSRVSSATSPASSSRSDGKRTPVDHGVVVVATGSREERPALYGLGDNEQHRHGHRPREHAEGRRPGSRRRPIGRLRALRRLARREPPLLLAHLLPAEHQERHPPQGAATRTGPSTCGSRRCAPSASSRSTTRRLASWASSSRATTTTARRR